MKTLILSALIFAAGLANAQQAVKRVSVNCATPAMLAGGESAVLKGILEIVISPSTGMTKVRTGSQLNLTLNGERAKITVQGIYFDLSAKERIEGTVDEDMSPFSTLNIYFFDKQNGQRSYLQRVNGQKILLECSH
jgi:hypothetical protein